MITQYCRYCSHMVCGDANYCEIKQATFTEKQIKVPNKCKTFNLNKIDALWENAKGYVPKVVIDKDDVKNQLRLEE